MENSQKRPRGIKISFYILSPEISSNPRWVKRRKMLKYNSILMIKIQKELVSEKQIKHLRGRFQFLILLMTFFPVLTEALFVGYTSQLDTSNQILNWGVVISLMV